MSFSSYLIALKFELSLVFLISLSGFVLHAILFSFRDKVFPLHFFFHFIFCSSSLMMILKEIRPDIDVEKLLSLSIIFPLCVTHILGNLVEI